MRLILGWQSVCRVEAFRMPLTGSEKLISATTALSVLRILWNATILYLEQISL